MGEAAGVEDIERVVHVPAAQPQTPSAHDPATSAKDIGHPARGLVGKHLRDSPTPAETLPARGSHREAAE